MKTKLFLIIFFTKSLFGDNLNLYFGGDTYFFSQFSPKQYYKDMELEEVLRDKDLFLLNLEGSFCDNLNNIKSCSSDKCYKVIHHEKNTLKKLQELKVDYVSLGNNHIMDCSITGSDFTQKLLDSNKIFYSGTLEKPYTIFNKNGNKIAVLSMGSNNFITSFNNQKNLNKILLELTNMKKNKTIDYLFAMVHMGTEEKNISSFVTGNEEIFLGEKRGNPKQIARDLIDKGFDIVVGHGPHVLRGIDLYKNKIILYSMGNFYTDTGINTKGLNGYSSLANLQIDQFGNFIKGKMIPLEQQTFHRPIIDIKKRSCIKIEELTKLLNKNVIFNGCDFIGVTESTETNAIQ